MYYVVFLGLPILIIIIFILFLTSVSGFVACILCIVTSAMFCVVLVTPALQKNLIKIYLKKKEALQQGYIHPSTSLVSVSFFIVE